MAASVNAFVRAGPANDTIEFLDQFRPGLRAQVEAKIGSQFFERVASQSRMSWIPFEDDVVFLEAIFAIVGERDMVTLFRRSVAHHFESKLLSAVITGAERIFGLTPYGLVKMIPRAWPMVYKGLGQPRVERCTETHAVVHVADAHPQLLGSTAYLRGWQGIFEGVVEAGGAKPERVRAELDPHPSEARMEIHMRW